ncbi:response regulator transcription factor [Streptomyces sp. NRRL S-118]|uniref:response regulator transcription factor n=1 Tax=Streptomyces sp. NRRL S-118 TaxID=1463881 RepID=UPI00099DBD55|nr:response regulator transcription factor [Streptomyces sp. NRRL S-118]
MSSTRADARPERAPGRQRDERRPDGGAPLRVAVHATDHVTYTGLARYLEGDPRVVVVGRDSAEEADVTVFTADTVSGETLHVLRGLSARRRTGPFLVVAGTRWKTDVALAVECGVRAVLWRRDTTPETFVRAVLRLGEGGGSLPADLQGRLLDQIQRTCRDVLIPQGLASARQLTVREADILRLISEGCDLADIAEKLAYSERTVKNILYRMMGRLELRNRAHAVSYAIRSGLI